MAYDTEVLADSPWLYWRLGESSGSTAQDATANNRDGTITGGTLGVTGAISGDTAYAVADNTDSVISAANFPSGVFTFEFWIRPTATPASGDVCVMASSVGGGGGSGIDIAMNGSRELYAFIWNGSSQQFTDTTPALALNTWAHVAVVANNTTLKIYVDGVEGGTVNTVAPTDSRPVLVGGVTGNIGNSCAFQVDEVAAYSSALSTTRISAHVSAAAGGTDATVTAVPADGTGDVANPSLAAGAVVTSPVLDGTGDIAVPVVSGSVNATVAAVALDATGDVANPAVGTGAIVVAPTLDATADVATAGMPMSAALDAPTLDAAGDVANPAVSASGTETVVAVPLDAAGDVANPALVAGAVVVAVTGDATGDVANPTVTGGSPPAGGAGARQLLGVGS
jgi:hypothetical protein